MMSEYATWIQYYIAAGVALVLLLQFLTRSRTGYVQRDKDGRRARAITWGLAALALVAGANYFYGLRSEGWLQRSAWRSEATGGADR